MSDGRHGEVDAGRRIIAIGAGKGGSGTSAVAANLGIFLAQIGKRVVLVDADVSDSGLHHWLGMRRPRRSMLDLVLGRYSRVEEALVDTPVSGLSFLGGAEDLLGEALRPEGHPRLLSMIRNIEADFVLLDLPAGLHPFSLELFAAADLSLAVTLATPDAVESTYRLLLGGLLKKMIRGIDREEVTAALAELSQLPGPPPTGREIVAAAAQHGAGREAELIAETYHPQLVVNQVRIKGDMALGEAMVSAAARWLGIVPRLLGTVEWDDNVWLSMRRGMPLLIDFPQSRACKGLERIVRRLLGLDFQELLRPIPIPPPVEEQNLYELLEIYPGASEEEVRRAMKRIREHFGSEGLAVRGACGETEREEFQRRAEEAHATLIDKSRRRAYDRSTFPDGFPSTSKGFVEDQPGMQPQVARPHDTLPRVELTDDVLVDGAFLGRIRRERGVELEDISNRAKISVTYLQAIEEERYTELPAPVYVRGFVTEFARYLKVDSRRAVHDFMAKYTAARKPKGR